MGLLQQAYRTYEYAEKTCVGKYIEGEKEPLAPIGHAITNATIEITLDKDGNFIGAMEIDKDNAKTLFPVTEDSLGRSGTSIRPHPLCDQIGFMMPDNKEKYGKYVEQLLEWASSEYTHPILESVLKYVKKGTIVDDVVGANAVSTDENGNIKDKKAFVRWRVIGIGDESGPCWTNRNLQNLYFEYYISKLVGADKDVCMVSGEILPIARMHAKGVVSMNGNAKLISANDTSNFTYRGRFCDEAEALTVGYEVSQKAHNALRWLIANQGEYFGGRMFLCFNPEGKPCPKPTKGIMARKSDTNEDKAVYVPSDYREKLQKTLKGWKTQLPLNANIITAVFDAATTGRLSISYYSEIAANDFIDRIGYWDETCCWLNRMFGIQSPSLRRIAEYAFGTLRNDHFEVDDNLLKNVMLRLVSCRLEKSKLPQDVEKQLVKKASTLYLYKDESGKWLRSELLYVTCAVIRKFYIDYYKEEWEMALNPERKDRSYQYGRLLAVLEKAERDTYGKDEDRETNAIRMQSIFVQRPQYATRVISEQVKRAYYNRLSVGSRNFYERLIGQIMDKLSEFEEEANKPLKDTYLLGYYLQKNDLYTKRSETESIEEE